MAHDTCPGGALPAPKTMAVILAALHVDDLELQVEPLRDAAGEHFIAGAVFPEIGDDAGRQGGVHHAVEIVVIQAR